MRIFRWSCRDKNQLSAYCISKERISIILQCDWRLEKAQHQHLQLLYHIGKNHGVTCTDGCRLISNGRQVAAHNRDTLLPNRSNTQQDPVKLEYSLVFFSESSTRFPNNVVYVYRWLCLSSNSLQPGGQFADHESKSNSALGFLESHFS